MCRLCVVIPGIARGQFDHKFRSSHRPRPLGRVIQTREERGEWFSDEDGAEEESKEQSGSEGSQSNNAQGGNDAAGESKTNEADLQSTSAAAPAAVPTAVPARLTHATGQKRKSTESDAEDGDQEDTAEATANHTLKKPREASEPALHVAASSSSPIAHRTRSSAVSAAAPHRSTAAAPPSSLALTASTPFPASSASSSSAAVSAAPTSSSSGSAGHAASACAASSSPLAASSFDSADARMIDEDDDPSDDDADAASRSSSSSASSSSSLPPSDPLVPSPSSWLQSALRLLSIFAEFQRTVPHQTVDDDSDDDEAADIQHSLLQAHLRSVQARVSVGVGQPPMRVLRDLLLSSLYMIDSALDPEVDEADGHFACRWMRRADVVATEIVRSLTPQEIRDSADRTPVINLSVRAGLIQLVPHLLGEDGDLAPTQFGEPTLSWLLRHPVEHCMDLTPLFDLFAYGLDPAALTHIDEPESSALFLANEMMSAHREHAWFSEFAHRLDARLNSAVRGLVSLTCFGVDEAGEQSAERREVQHGAFVRALIPAWCAHSRKVHALLLSAAPDRLIPDLACIVAEYLGLELDEE